MGNWREWLLEVWLIATLVSAFALSGIERSMVIAMVPFIIRRIAEQEARRG